ncbi:MAG: 1-(5-phosphoribosyl)-5-[(5-phosphoribosylamino)methylideneamino]imidazole-4-carboxamide isomerase [Oscillospiraceae bacterium]
MIILPAIDINDGNCVRLYKGDFATVQKVAQDPIETALMFQKLGATHLHMVDLDGAKTAKTSNKDLFLQIAKVTNLQIELGGGIRNSDDIEDYLSGGIAKVILGSAALKDPEFVKTCVKEYGEHIVVGIDARNRMVATEGWLDSSDVDYIDLAKQMEMMGVKNIVFTDISKDGTLKGPNIVQLKEINEAVSCNITASGGISCINDIIALKKLNMYGAICGKSLYQKTLDLKEALAVGWSEK